MKTCDRIQIKIESGVDPKSEEALKIKQTRRAHNFEKFRTEAKDLINRHFKMLEEDKGMKMELILCDLENERKKNANLSERVNEDSNQVKTL